MVLHFPVSVYKGVYSHVGLSEQVVGDRDKALALEGKFNAGLLIWLSVSPCSRVNRSYWAYSACELSVCICRRCDIVLLPVVFLMRVLLTRGTGSWPLRMHAKQNFCYLWSVLLLLRVSGL